MQDLVSQTRSSLQIFGQLRSISDIWNPGQSLLNKKCNHSRTSHDIDIKVGPVTTLDKRSTATSKKIENDVMWRYCLFSDLWPICSHLEAGFWTDGLENLHFH